MNFDEFSTREIYMMIANGVCTYDDVAEYYGNQWWDEIP